MAKEVFLIQFSTSMHKSKSSYLESSPVLFKSCQKALSKGIFHVEKCIDALFSDLASVQTFPFSHDDNILRASSAVYSEPVCNVSKN